MTAPRPRTIDAVSAPFENYLLPVPAPAHDVCGTCHSSKFGDFPNCYPCHDARRQLPARADAVASISLAPDNEQLARDFYAYKDQRLSSAIRRPLMVGLAALTYKWLRLHEACLAGAAGIREGTFDVITSVPSTSARAGTHPLVSALSEVVVGSKDRYADLLTVNRTDVGSREYVADRFRATVPPPSNVLVVDDSWVTGAKPQAAAAALKHAGASRVGVLTIGRWVNLGYEKNPDWLKDKRKPGWSWDSCCLH